MDSQKAGLDIKNMVGGMVLVILLVRSGNYGNQRKKVRIVYQANCKVERKI